MPGSQLHGLAQEVQETMKSASRRGDAGIHVLLDAHTGIKRQNNIGQRCCIDGRSFRSDVADDKPFESGVLLGDHLRSLPRK